MTMTAEREAAEALSVAQDADIGRAVRITWIDSGQAAHGWQSIDSLPAATPTIETVGLWMGENANVMMVGGSHDAINCNWGECQLIWKPAVLNKEWLA